MRSGLGAGLAACQERACRVEEYGAPEDGDQTDRHAKYIRWLHHSEHLTERERRQEALADEFAVLAEAIEECDSD